ncbi:MULTISPECIES: hypothetical protein [unclassified Stenotrophomonas]|uniref:hypothetical protein n=1 Tax=unclassified Stenotrophomonas TaxID=196198 RepID=UPI003467A50B
MPIEFCPLADEVGNLADWFAVGVGTIAAVSTTVVAFLAYRTSKRATDIAEEAKGIARQQHGEAVKLRQENARIIGRLLLYEVVTLPTHLSALLTAWEDGIDWTSPATIKKGQQLLRVLDGVSRSLVPGAERVEERIHNLPDSIGADLATLIGGGRTLAEIAATIVPRIVHPSMSNGGRFGYKGDHEDFSLLRQQLKWLLEISSDFEKEFRAFVGIRPSDASHPGPEAAAVSSIPPTVS